VPSKKKEMLLKKELHVSVAVSVAAVGGGQGFLWSVV
jgi:hypothetical protein